MCIYQKDFHAQETAREQVANSAILQTLTDPFGHFLPLEPSKATHRKTTKEAEPAVPEIIVGFDSEWVNGAHAEDEHVAADKNIVLSYQFAVLNAATGAEETFIHYTRGKTQSHRFNFGYMLGKILRAARNRGVFADIPDRVTVVGHFLRADLSAVRNWQIWKKKVDSLRRTVCTTSKPATCTIPLAEGGSRRKNVTVRFADTMLLAAQGSPLKKLGETIGVEKIELPAGAIEHMDLLLRDDPVLFERYAKQDAIIAARYYRQTRQTLAKLGVTKSVATLGEAVVLMIIAVVERLGISPDYYFGYERDDVGRRQNLTSLTTMLPFAANCFHGGRNEAYRVGLTPKGTLLYDLDLKGAYTTALAMVRVPDWESRRIELNVQRLAVVDEAMTFARVRFEFPEETRFPSLPVRAGERGLVYPLNGVSWCTGAELVVALTQGARIEVEEGWCVEWREGSPRPFETFARSINDTRKAARTSGDALLNLTAKEIGNSAYGKIAQAVAGERTVHDGGVYAPRGKRVFDARTGTMTTLGPSRITNPMLAGFVTGLVRAALSEALARLPNSAIVATATTDGFLSSIPLERVDTSGAVAETFAKARKAIDGDENIWETKHVIGRALVMKTRGTITVEGVEGEASEPVLARAGYKLEYRPFDKWDECRIWREKYATRDYATRGFHISLSSLREQWLGDSDLVEKTTNVRLNLDFDMKRRVVESDDSEGLLCAETKPWRTLADFQIARDGLEAWKKSRRRVLKTEDDLRDLESWTANREGRKASGSTAQSSRPPFISAFLRGMVRGLLRTAWPYKRLAEFLTENGFPTSVDVVKQAKRRGDLALGVLTDLSSQERAFVEAVYSETPDIALERLVAPNSPAARVLAAAKRRGPEGSGPRDERLVAMPRASVTSLENHAIPAGHEIAGPHR